MQGVFYLPGLVTVQGRARVCLSIQWSRLCLLTCSSSLTPLSTPGLGMGVGCRVAEPGEEEDERGERENKQGDTSDLSQLPALVTNQREDVQPLTPFTLRQTWTMITFVS